MSNCSICGRPLIPHEQAAPDDPAMDCGGDCLACMQEIEGVSDQPVTAWKLADAEYSYKLATRRAETHRRRRNEIVREALSAGWTHAQISEATGLSRGRIGQIAQRG